MFSSVSLETLEQRALFTVMPEPGSDFATAFHIGDLNGTVSFSDSVSPTDQSDFYAFSLSHQARINGRLHAAAPGLVHVFQEKIDAKGNVSHVLLDERFTNVNTVDTDLAQELLPVGNYFIAVESREGSFPYDIRLTSDFAGESLTEARDIGSATDATFQDFVGRGPTFSSNDPSDFYKVKMDAAGTLKILLKNDIRTDSILTHAELIEDFNGNGAIDPGDELFPPSMGSTTQRLTKDLAAGTYFVRVVGDLGFTNYHLRINADYAGDQPGTARLMGSLDSGKTFNDFISSIADPTIFDTTDQYHFSISATRTIFLSEIQQGGMSSLSLFKDANNDGIAQPGELVTRQGAGVANQLVASIGPGNYIVQVLASSGTGTYELFAETRPDGAGNTLKTAKNLGTVNGRKGVDDYVSVDDPTDIYKFTASASGTIGASVFTEFDPEHAFSADVTLIRDANNNGIVDSKEILASGAFTSTGSKEFSKSITAGTYFLRVSNKAGVSAAKYFLTFQTDLAGSTPKAARNVGALAGTKNFDDWASGPFGGAISDTLDVYKFSLSSTKTFSSKLIGSTSGQDLDLELYRDKNNDGVLSASELVASSKHADSPNEQISKSLASGTYFLRVVGVNGETNYHLSLKA